MDVSGPSNKPTLVTKKHDTLYMPDGNIILSASNQAAEHMLFCVHQSILSKTSSIFADMFALPPSDANAMYEGLPIVHMPDKAEDLELLLKVLYHEIDIPKRLDPNMPSVVKPIVSLAIKYEMNRLKKQLVNRITEDWPTSLHAWDTIESEIAGMKYRWHEQQQHEWSYDHVVGSPKYMDDHLPEPVSAINLAKECGIPCILPATFYHLSRLSLRWGSDGSERDPLAQDRWLSSGGRTAKWKSLAGEDYYRLFVGRDTLKSEVADEMHSEVFLHTDNHFINHIKESLPKSDDVLYDLRRFINILDDPEQCRFHGVVKDLYLPRLTEFRSHIWDNLPRYFGLEHAVCISV